MTSTTLTMIPTPPPSEKGPRRSSKLHFNNPGNPQNLKLNINLKKLNKQPLKQPIQQQREPTIEELEREVRASAQAKLDIQRVKNALQNNISSNDDAKSSSVSLPSPSLPTNDTDTTATTTALTTGETKQQQVTMTVDSSPDPSSRRTPPSPSPPSNWNIALASGACTSLLSLSFLHDIPILSLGVFAAVTYIASRDPTNDELLLPNLRNTLDGGGSASANATAITSDISGPIARIVGRATITSIEKSKPKVKAVARAVISSQSDLEALQSKIDKLEEENLLLKEWIERRQKIDDMGKMYTLGKLKDIARRDGLLLGGTKIQLMMRLIEAGSLEL